MIWLIPVAFIAGVLVGIGGTIAWAGFVWDRKP